MQLKETMTVDALRANKLRAVLALIGIIIGSAFIILVITVALTGGKYVISQIEAVGSNLVWAEMVRTPDKAQPVSHELTVADMEAVQTTIPDAVMVAGISNMPVTVEVGGRTRTVALVGVTPGYEQIRRPLVLHGRYFDSQDMATPNKVCLVSKEVAQKVLGVDNPIGRSLRAGELTFTVIGVFREKASTHGLSEIQEYSVLIPLPLMKYFKGQDVLSTLFAQASGPDQVESLKRQMILLLNSRHPADAHYNVQTLKAVLRASKMISFALTVVLLIIALIAILVGIAGIMGGLRSPSALRPIRREVWPSVSRNQINVRPYCSVTRLTPDSSKSEKWFSADSTSTSTAFTRTCGYRTIM